MTKSKYSSNQVKTVVGAVVLLVAIVTITYLLVAGQERFNQQCERHYGNGYIYDQASGDGWKVCRSQSGDIKPYKLEWSQ